MDKQIFIKDIMEDKQKETIYKNQSLTNRPSHEAVFMSASKKAEKISIALYMVTDLVNPNDPIRQRIRECSIELIGETRSMSYAFSGDIYFIIARAINKSWELVSLIDVASSVGFISDMNANIIRSVVVELISSLREKQKRDSFNQIEDLKIGDGLSNEITLSKSLFESEDDYKGQIIKDNKMSFTKPAKTLIYKKNEYAKSTNKPEFSKAKTSDRREKVLQIIREKGEVTISDITTLFPEFSSKTIQRELISLVNENVIKKEGDKRWSKYSIFS